MRLLFIIAVLSVVIGATLALQPSCSVTPLPHNTVLISECSFVSLETRGGFNATGGSGTYKLPPTTGCTVLIVTDEYSSVVYRICNLIATPSVCPDNELFANPLDAARACAQNVWVDCAEDCCIKDAGIGNSNTCCVEEEKKIVGTWVGHSWDDFIGSDGIPIQETGMDDDGDVLTGRIRVENGSLVASCDYNGTCDIGCVLGMPMTILRDIFIPNCSPFTLTVDLEVDSVPPGTTAQLGTDSPTLLNPGTNTLTGTSGPLNITIPVPVCASDITFVLNKLEIDSLCVTKIDAPKFCPMPGCEPGEAKDAEGVCCVPERLDCNNKCNGYAFVDVCGKCRLPGDPRENGTCTGCDGVVYPPPLRPAVTYECNNETICMSPDDPEFGACRSCTNKLLLATWMDEEGIVVKSAFVNPIPSDTETVAEWYNGARIPDPTREDALAFTAFRDSTGGVFFVTTVGPTVDPGSTVVVFRSTNMDGSGLVLVDDVDDTHVFDPVSISGIFHFGWSEGENDGFVVGPCPRVNAACVTLDIKKHSSLRRFRVNTWDKESQYLIDAAPHHHVIPDTYSLKVCTVCTDRVDCDGVENGPSVLDECSVCRLPSDPHFNSTCTDCAGVVNGGSVEDICGVCGGDNSSCNGCPGVFDACGVCDGDNTTCVDCAGAVNGEAVLDQCGVCGGDDSSCLDCNGVINGTSVFDDCHVCGGDGTTCLNGTDRTSLLIGSSLILLLAGACLLIYVVSSPQPRRRQTSSREVLPVSTRARPSRGAFAPITVIGGDSSMRKKSTGRPTGIKVIG